MSKVNRFEHFLPFKFPEILFNIQQNTLWATFWNPESNSSQLNLFWLTIDHLKSNIFFLVFYCSSEKNNRNQMTSMRNPSNDCWRKKNQSKSLQKNFRIYISVESHLKTNYFVVILELTTQKKPHIVSDFTFKFWCINESKNPQIFWFAQHEVFCFWKLRKTRSGNLLKALKWKTLWTVCGCYLERGLKERTQSVKANDSKNDLLQNVHVIYLILSYLWILWSKSLFDSDQRSNLVFKKVESREWFQSQVLSENYLAIAINLIDLLSSNLWD